MAVVALLSAERARRNLRRAHQRGGARRMLGALRFADSWTQVLDAVSKGSTCLAVVDPYRGGDLQLRRIREISCLGVAGLIAYAEFETISGALIRPAGRDVALLLEAGAAHVVTFGVDDSPAELLSVMELAVGHGALSGVLTRVEQHLPWRQRIAVEWAIREGLSRQSVAIMARDLGVSTRTIRRWFASNACLSPHALLAWGRILRGTLLLLAGDTELTDVAHLTGYRSGAEFRRQFRHLTGATDRHPMEEWFPLASARFFALLLGPPERNDRPAARA